MSKKVLVVVSEHGFWVEELLLPTDHLKKARYELQFITATGTLPFPDAASMDATYQDPPLGRAVTSVEIAQRGKSMDWESFFAGRLSLEELMPIRPYLSHDNYLHALEEYYGARDKAWSMIGEYDALLLVGGAGPFVDMVNNPRLLDLILGFYYADKLIACECYAVTCLAFARELDQRTSIIRGKHVTGHTMEYDYTKGWGLWANGDYLVFNNPPVSLEYILRDAVVPDGQFHGNVGRPLSVILDHPFLTSRSVSESTSVARFWYAR